MIKRLWKYIWDLGFNEQLEIMFIGLLVNCLIFGWEHLTNNPALKHALHTWVEWIFGALFFPVAATILAKVVQLQLKEIREEASRPRKAMTYKQKIELWYQLSFIAVIIADNAFPHIHQHWLIIPMHWAKILAWVNLGMVPLYIVVRFFVEAAERGYYFWRDSGDDDY